MCAFKQQQELALHQRPDIITETRLRSEPTLEQRSWTGERVVNGEYVAILRCENGLAYVRKMDGKEGFVKLDYLHTQDQNLADLIFHPGPVGLQYEFATGVIEDVDAGGQADRMGVKLGWMMKTIDGAPYSKELFQQRRDGRAQYEIAFSKQAGTAQPSLSSSCAAPLAAGVAAAALMAAAAAAATAAANKKDGVAGSAPAGADRHASSSSTVPSQAVGLAAAALGAAAAVAVEMASKRDGAGPVPTGATRQSSSSSSAPAPAAGMAAAALGVAAAAAAEMANKRVNTAGSAQAGTARHSSSSSSSAPTPAAGLAGAALGAAAAVAAGMASNQDNGFGQAADEVISKTIDKTIHKATGGRVTGVPKEAKDAAVDYIKKNPDQAAKIVGSVLKLTK